MDGNNHISRFEHVIFSLQKILHSKSDENCLKFDICTSISFSYTHLRNLSYSYNLVNFFLNFLD